MSENRDLLLEIWTEMAQKQPKLEEMGKYIKKIVEWDPTLNEYDAVRICRFRQIYYDDLEKFLNIVYLAILFIITDTQEDMRNQQMTVCCFVWLKWQAE